MDMLTQKKPKTRKTIETERQIEIDSQRLRQSEIQKQKKSIKTTNRLHSFSHHAHSICFSFLIFTPL